MALKSYKEVQDFLNKVLKDNHKDGQTAIAPHADWWNSMSYEDFISKDVPGVLDPNTGDPMKTLIVGDSAHSNIICALRATAGTVFDKTKEDADPNFSAIARMPKGGPYFTDAQINELADWIDAGCPK